MVSMTEIDRKDLGLTSSGPDILSPHVEADTQQRKIEILMADYENEIKSLRKHLQLKKTELSRILSSRSWALIQRLRRIRHRVLPRDSLRERMAILLFHLTRLAAKVAREVLSAPLFFPLQIYYAHKVQQLLKAHPECKGVVIQLPVVDWNWMKQRPHHLSSEFARAGYLTLFCTPQVRGDVISGVRQIGERLYLCSNVRMLRRVSQPYVLATYPGHWREVRKLCRPRLIYDNLDDLQVHYGGGKITGDVLRQHQELLEEAEVVLATAGFLHDKVLPVRPDAILCPNGVDVGHFALISTPPVPKDLRPIQESGHPIIGYYGALAEWFDYELLAAAARRLPEYEFVLIGPNYDSSLFLHDLREISNVHWLGEKQYEVLPQYAHFFTVATIPFLINEITRCTSPVKLFEYLAAGKQIVTTDLPECRKFEGVLIAHDVFEYVEHLRVAVSRASNATYRQKLLQQARANSWQARFALIEQRLSERRRNRTIPQAADKKRRLQA
jgi:glycosyltransferase involved in cell wall biosynthesis